MLEALEREPGRNGERLRLGPDGAASVTADQGSAPTAGSWTAERLAFWAFVAYLAVAWWFLVFHVGADGWFLRDDWWFLSDRNGGNLDDLLRPHGEHLTLLPIVVYRVLLNLFGVRFTPFLVLIVSMHLTVAALLRVVMRRAGVGPWLATAAAAPLVLFGPGHQNIRWAFQITFVGSLLFGLVQLVLADHDGPITRRDWAGLAAGAAALLCSGLGPLMVAVVGAVALVRRGWRAALFHVAPLAFAYLVWYRAQDVRTSSTYGRPPLSEVWAWVRVGTTSTYDALGNGAIVGAALAVMLLAGLALWGVSTSWREARRQAAPLVLLCALPIFMAVTSQGRWLFGPEFASSSRYLHVGAVFVLPAMALAAQTLCARWPRALPALALLFLFAVPANAAELRDPDGTFFVASHARHQRQTILGVARSPELAETPSWVRPEPHWLNGPGLTVGWLLEQRSLGRLPDPSPIDPDIAAQFPLRLALVHAREPGWMSDCAVEDGPVRVVLHDGDRFRITAPVSVTLLEDDAPVAPPLVYSPRDGTGTLSVVTDELAIELGPPPRASSFEWCR